MLEERSSKNVTWEQVRTFEHMVIRMQALARGFIIRKEKDLRATKGRFDASIHIEELLHNSTVNEVRRREGPFNFEALDLAPLNIPEQIKLIDRGPFRMTNGSVYKG